MVAGAKELAQRTKKENNYEEVTLVVKECKNIIRPQEKGILNVPFSEGKFLKCLNESERFVEMIYKAMRQTINYCFKLNLLKILEKYLKLKKSSLSLNVFQNYRKTIKKVCKESGSEFQ